MENTARAFARRLAEIDPTPGWAGSPVLVFHDEDGREFVAEFIDVPTFVGGLRESREIAVHLVARVTS